MVQSFEVFYIDAFSERSFHGNPAAVVPLGEEWLPDAVMQGIASENNLSETAFVVTSPEGYLIRWFSPKREVDFCGHATLAAAYVLSTASAELPDHPRIDRPGSPGPDELVFQSPRSGPVRVALEGARRFVLDLAADPVTRCEVPVGAARAVGTIPVAAYVGSEIMLLVLERARSVATLKPDFRIISQFPAEGVVATAPGAPDGPADWQAPENGADFVCRFFAPQSGTAEDPVTAAAQATAGPFWAQRLQRDHLRVHQLSPRGGTLTCRIQNGRVQVGGAARLYMHGTVYIDT